MPECLRVYINILCEGTTGFEAGAQESELLITGFMCKCYGKQLIDPVDRPPGIETTSLRIVESIHRYFLVIFV
jgi:hypothetical protein